MKEISKDNSMKIASSGMVIGITKISKTKLMKSTLDCINTVL